VTLKVKVGDPPGGAGLPKGVVGEPPSSLRVARGGGWREVRPPPLGPGEEGG